MSAKEEKWIVRRNRLKKAYEALYHEVAVYFGLSDTVVWTLYTLMDSDGELTQQELVEKWKLPKQTINSAIQNLCQNGYTTLSVIPGTRNRKLIRLTDKGKSLVEETTVLLARAEEKAASRLTEEERETYLSLSQKFYDFLDEQTGIIRNK